MRDNTNQFEELLLDAHLDQIDDDERKRLAEELANNPELQKKNERLMRVLRPLDYYTAPTAPANLVEKVLKNAAGSRSTSGAKMSPTTDERGGHSRPFITMRELGAVAACLVLLMGALVPTLSKVRQHSHRVRCEGNMGDIYRGLSAYQGDFDGSLPYRGELFATAWMQGGTNEPNVASNSRHCFGLLKNGYVENPRMFLCPADKSAKAMETEGLNQRDDFTDDSISYDSLNLAASNPNVRPVLPIAYLGDANPLFNNGQFDETIDPYAANSFVHQKSGQNVLLLDGSATFLKSPVYGDRRDNVWLAGSIRKYTGSETPTRDDDAQLVPGFSAKKNVRAPQPSR